MTSSANIAEGDARRPATYVRITPETGSGSSGLRELMRYRDLVLLFVRRNFVTSYTQTVLGPLWLLIRPLFTSIMQLFVFGTIAGIGTDGVPGLLFYLSGNALWEYFSSAFAGNANIFADNAYLFGKVYFPRLVMPISNIMSAAVSFCISMLLFSGFYLWFFVHGMVAGSIVGLLLVPVLLVHLGLLGLGCGAIFSSLTTRYRDLRVLVGFGLSLWMYATPVVYPLSQLADPTLRTLLCVNPVTMPMEVFRSVLFGQGTVVPWAVALSWALTLALLAMGTRVFGRVEKNFIDSV